MATNWKLVVSFQENIDRVANLIQLYEQHPKAKGSGRKPVEASDILRAAVVLLHANFEEMCRTVERDRLPAGGEEHLNDVPLVGLSKSSRPEKFFLGKLLPHREKNVDALIRESIDAHLAQSSYNTVEDFCSMLKRAGLEKKPFEALFPGLRTLMERRHHIVHQCDRNSKRGAGQQSFRPIGKGQVMRWNECIRSVCNGLSSTKLPAVRGH